MALSYQLGLDMGATSIGWCVLKLDENDQPCAVLDMGARIFSDGRDAKTKKPLSVQRREARSARRRRDRFVLRRKDLLNALIGFGLMPMNESSRQALKQIDPWQARAEAAEGPVELHHLGRALFHLNQRRGFKSNRLADDATEDNELAGMKSGIQQLREALGKQTLGQFLYQRHHNGQAVRMRPQTTGSQKNEWDLYADRQMYLDEFDRIMAVQQAAHKALNPAVVAKLKEIIFRQRDLKIPEPGWCALLDNERRAPLAYPIVQKFRIYQEINNLQIENFGEGLPALTQADRKKLILALTRTFEGVTKQGILTWAGIRKLLGIQGKVDFNLHKMGRKGLQCDWTSRRYSAEEALGEHWFEFSDQQQIEMIDCIRTEPNRQKLVDRLIAKFHIEPKQADAIASIGLVKSYAHVSRKAIENILPGLQAGLTYDKACAQAGIQHSNQRTGEVYAHGDLPYYGEVMPKHALGGDHDQPKSQPEAYYGKINNPTVHIALNQLRLIINALYKRYGSAPQQIHLELARELKLPRWKLDDIEKAHKKNRALNEKIDEELQKHGIAVNYDNRMKYKLWQDLAEQPEHRCCPFSGTVISLSNLFSPDIEVEHLIPFSQSFDDSRRNKVLCTRKANRDKGNRAPFHAFGNSPGNYDWPEIMARVENLHPSKRWRFQADAMEKLAGEQNTMIARLLTDTQYMSRVGRQYMELVVGDPTRVVTSNGALTAKLRHHWGLNRLLSAEDIKERGDHRHHAIDALVIACISRSNVQKTQRAASKAEAHFLEKAIEDMPPPFPGFDRDQIQRLVNEMVISHKPNNSNPRRALTRNRTKDQLHEDTNWGLIGPGNKTGYSIYATRKALSGIPNKEKDILEIAHPSIRDDLLTTYAQSHTAKSWQEYLHNYGKQHGIRRVRIHRQKADQGMIPIHNKEGQPYRFVQGGNNFCMDIWCTDKGPKAGKWQAWPITMFEAHQDDTMPGWRKENPTAWRVMRLHINDVICYEENKQNYLSRVKKINTDGRIVVRDLRIAKEQGDKLSWTASANQLQLKNARRVWIDPLGRVHDAGRARKVEP